MEVSRELLTTILSLQNTNLNTNNAEIKEMLEWYKQRQYLNTLSERIAKATETRHSVVEYVENVVPYVLPYMETVSYEMLSDTLDALEEGVIEYYSMTIRISYQISEIIALLFDANNHVYGKYDQSFTSVITIDKNTSISIDVRVKCEIIKGNTLITRVQTQYADENDESYYIDARGITIEISTINGSHSFSPSLMDEFDVSIVTTCYERASNRMLIETVEKNGFDINVYDDRFLNVLISSVVVNILKMKSVEEIINNGYHGADQATVVISTFRFDKTETSDANTATIDINVIRSSLHHWEENVTLAFSMSDGVKFNDQGAASEPHVYHQTILNASIQGLIYENERKSAHVARNMLTDMINELYVYAENVAAEGDDYLSRISFTTIARVDELLQTTIRYEPRTISFDSIISGGRIGIDRLNSAVGSATFQCPFRIRGFNELNGTFEQEPQNTLRPSSGTISYENTAIPYTTQGTNFVLYEDGDYTILLEVTLETYTRSDPTDPISRTNFTFSNTMSYYDFDMQCSSLGAMTNTQHVGIVPVPIESLTFDFSVGRLIIVLKQAINVPLIDTVSGNVDIIFPRLDTATNNLVQTSVTAMTSGEAVLNGVRYGALFYTLNRTNSNNLYNTHEEYVYAYHNTKVAWLSTVARETITSNQNVTTTRLTRDSNYPVQWVRDNGFNVVVRTVQRDQVFHNIIGTRYLYTDSLDVRCQVNASIFGRNAQLFLRNERLSSLQNFQLSDGTNHAWVQVLNAMDDNQYRLIVNPFHLLSAVVVHIRNLAIEFRIPVPPENVGVREGFNNAQSDLQLLVNSIHTDLAYYSEVIQDMMDQLDFISQQISDINGGGVGDAILSILMDVGLTLALGAVGVIAKQLITGAVAGVKILGATFSKATRLFSRLGTQVRNGVGMPVQAINTHLTSVRNVTRAKGNSRWTDMARNINADNNIKLDANSFQLSYLLPEFSMGTRNAMYTRRRDDVRLLMNVDPKSNEGPLHVMKIHYQPLQVLESTGINQRVFDRINFDKLDAKYAYRPNKLASHQPAHAWSSMQSYYQTSEGRPMRTTMTFGVGEHGGLHRGEMSGRISGIKFIEEIDSETVSGKMRYRLRPFNESGYTDQDIRQLYAATFKLSQDVSITTQSMWSHLYKHTSNIIANTRVAHEHTFVSPFMHSAIEALFKNPPNLPYNLWSRNCQHLMDDLVRFIKGYPISDTWGLNMQSRMTTAYYRAIDIALDLGESSARVFISAYNSAIVYLSNFVGCRTI